MDILNIFVFILGLLYMLYAIGSVFLFALCCVVALGVLLKDIFFPPKKDDYLGPLI